MSPAFVPVELGYVERLSYWRKSDSPPCLYCCEYYIWATHRAPFLEQFFQQCLLFSS